VAKWISGKPERRLTGWSFHAFNRGSIQTLPVTRWLPCVGAVLALLLTRSELDVMSIIGIILLIGIVKKNAIMMIDFALNAERSQNKSTRDSIFEASTLRFRPILMTTVACPVWRRASGRGHGNGLGAPAPPRRFDHRRTDRQPDSDSVHDPGGLSAHGYNAHETQQTQAGERGRTGGVDGMKRGIWQVLLGAVLLGSCTVGPKYIPPAVAAPVAFKESAPAAYSSALPGAWQPANPQDAVLKGKWWEMFNEPELNTLEEQLNISNQNIAIYFQNFMAARAQVGEARANYFPTVTTSPAITRSGRGPGSNTASATPVSTGGGTTVGGTAAGTATANGTLISLPFDASWEPDLWGRVRNTVAEFRAGAQVSAADLENERLTEQASLAEFYFELRGQDALQDVLHPDHRRGQRAARTHPVLIPDWNR